MTRCDRRSPTALALARRFDSYIEGFALRFRVNEFIAVDMAGAIPLETLREESLDEAKRARVLFESFMRENDVPRGERRRGRRTILRMVRGGAERGKALSAAHGRVLMSS